ncbi:MAG: BTAD domain-containing putative transcriptional regulator [Chloroflexota bacterium]
MSKQLTIRLFGPLAIELAGKPVTDLGTRKAEALLVFLVSQKRPFSREVLADLLWDDRSQPQALANLRSLLSGLMRQLKPFLLVTRHTVGFNHESDYWLDTAEFSQLLGIGPWRPERPAPASILNLHSLEKAAALFRGDFLEGFYLRDARLFEEWASLERERLQRAADHALQELVSYHLAHGSYEEGIHRADQLLKLNNLSERANRSKMLLLARLGQRNAALKQYETYRRQLAVELDVEPAAETTAVYERIRSSLANKAHNLPPQNTPFVGREPELADFQQRLIDPACRLLTLLGPGGMGKTRLALAAAERIAQQQPGLFLHGIRFAPLAAVPTPDLLPTAVADACDLSTQGQESPFQQLLAYLQDKEMLLVLDNFEHLFGQGVGSPDGVDLLLSLLQQAPLLQILVTSRERLNLHEEWVFDLAGLEYPPEPPDREITAYSAVQLFRQNAERIQRQFAPTAEDWTAVAQVCRLLEGMPLGIELAAAWTRDYSCPEIARQMQAGVDFLTTRLRNVPPRHRSLTAVFDHSWALLAAAEQQVFARLSIFRSSFTAAAAAAVAQATPDMLTTLSSKSLLRGAANASPEQGGSGRYELHELLRQYAAGKLAEHADDAAETAVCHMRLYLELLAAQGEGEKPAERQIIQADLPNIRQAWQEAVKQRAYGLLEQGAPVLHNYFSIQSKFQEGIHLFQFALDQLAATPLIEPEPAQAMCALWGRKARLHIHIGQLAAARQALDRAMALLPLVEDPQRHADVLGYTAITTFYAGDFAHAVDLMTKARQLSESIGDGVGIARATNFLGSCAKALGDYDAAEARFRQAVTLYQQLGDELGAAMVLNNLGNVAQAKGDFATAQGHYLACSEMFKAINHSHGAATTLANAGRLALKQAQFDDARALLSESLALKRTQHDDRGTAVALIGLGGVSVATGAYTQAQLELAEALALSQSCGDLKLALEGLAVLAVLAARQGFNREAVTVLAFILAQKATAQEVRDNAEEFLAEAREALSDSEQARAAAAGEKMDLETAVSLLIPR